MSCIGKISANDHMRKEIYARCSSSSKVTGGDNFLKLKPQEHVLHAVGSFKQRNHQHNQQSQAEGKSTHKAQHCQKSQKSDTKLFTVLYTRKTLQNIRIQMPVTSILSWKTIKNSLNL